MPSSPFQAPGTPTQAHDGRTFPAPQRRLGSGTTLAMYLWCAMPVAIGNLVVPGGSPARHGGA